jgi:hypothetical protein
MVQMDLIGKQYWPPFTVAISNHDLLLKVYQDPLSRTVLGLDLLERPATSGIASTILPKVHTRGTFIMEA